MSIPWLDDANEVCTIMTKLVNFVPPMLRDDESVNILVRDFEKYCHRWQQHVKIAGDAINDKKKIAL